MGSYQDRVRRHSSSNYSGRNDRRNDHYNRSDRRDEPRGPLDHFRHPEDALEYAVGGVMAMEDVIDKALKDIDTLARFMTAHENTFFQMYEGKYDGDQGGVINYSRDQANTSRNAEIGEETVNNEGRRKGYGLANSPMSAAKPNYDAIKKQISDEPAHVVHPNQSQPEETHQEQPMIQDYILSVPKKCPFGTNNSNWTKYLRSSTDKYITITGQRLQATSLLDACSLPNTGSDEISANIGYFASVMLELQLPKGNLEMIKNNLITPPENLHLILTRIMQETSNVDDLMFLAGLNKMITNKLNDLLLIYGDIGLASSYCKDLEDIKQYIRSNTSNEFTNAFFTHFNSILAQTVQDVYRWVLEEVKGSEGEVLAVPLYDNHTVMFVDRYSQFLGLDNLSFDGFDRVDLKSQDNALIVDAIAGVNNGQGLFSNKEFYILTKDAMFFKLMYGPNNELYIKRHATNMQ